MENQLDEWNNLIREHRPYLLSFAFRMTGSLSESEDIVQDIYLECSKIDPRSIKNHKAWLTKVCSNKALDHLKKAYKRREVYTGVWLPDEVPESLQIWGHLIKEESPEDGLILSESLTTSFLLLLQKLSPEERVIYLLSDIFNYSFDEISNLLDKKIVTCRKVAQRARESLEQDKKRFSYPTEGSYELLQKFFSLAKSGDVQGINSLLAPNSELWGDGGGKVQAAGFINETDKIISFFNVLVQSEVFKSEKYKVEFHQVNSRPGIIISKELDDGLWGFDTILSFEFSGEKIACIYAQRNPEKLSSLTKNYFI